MANWISRLADRLADLYHLPAMNGGYDTEDPQARRARADLDAIRIRFPDHA
ncbi:hypothetical protein [Mycobacterium sp. SMC-4]|uniref:hypothetical protein n=1 Tax=Mycobacterium sp. SMC-4 TaxID=2857059 RepID=UPI0021B4290F|nr:hypothetical protein [Mycobacterium sp. SMC-4]UXA21070.1 hypothetical protein KXD98_08790 [Mycobacterium sp. SMC-4]